MVDISHLVVIGCSFSYGQGLDNPKEDSWPGILSKKLNVPIVNLSSRGGGNDRIMRRLYEYHYLNSSKNNNPFYVIAYSHSSRREEYIKDSNDYMVVSMKNDPSIMKGQPFSTSCILNYDSFVCARRKLMIRSYIADFFKNHNINYLVTDFMPDNEDELQRLSEIYPEPYNRIYEDRYRLKNLGEISIKHPKLQCGHDGIEANLEIGNYVYEELILRYGLPTTLSKDYIALAHYIDHYDLVGNKGDTAWL